MKTPLLISLLSTAALLTACDAKKEEAPVASADAAPADGAKTEAAPEANADAKPEAAAVAKAEAAPEAAQEADGAHDGCLHGDGEPKAEGESCDHQAPPAAGTAGHFGAPFNIEQAKPLDEVLASFDPAAAAPVLVSGEVKSVCQAKGCWMVIEQGDKQARVLMKDHSFAVPMDGEGAAARVEGVLTERTLSEAQVKHIEKDAGKDPEAVSGERKEYILTATGVELTRS